MRINRYVALATGMSRRAADEIISEGRVLINGQPAQLSAQVEAPDRVTYNGHTLSLPQQYVTVMLNKPTGYVCSRIGQGSKTVYDLLPEKYHSLKPIGRLDKDSSGLLLLTTNGDLANHLTHPSYDKQKIYHIKLNKPLQQKDAEKIQTTGVKLDEGPSSLQIESIGSQDGKSWRIIMHEGRNRQIRRTFEALGYTVTDLHRVQFGPYSLNTLQVGQFVLV